MSPRPTVAPKSNGDPHDAQDARPLTAVSVPSSRMSTLSNRLTSIDRDECKQKNEAEFLHALNSAAAARRQTSVEVGVIGGGKVSRDRTKHPICDRVVVIIVVVGILFMMCTVLAALYLLLRILLSPTTQKGSPYGVAALANSPLHGSYHDTNIEMRDLIDKARRLLSSPVGSRLIQPRGRLKISSSGLGATTTTVGSTLITSDSYGTAKV